MKTLLLLRHGKAQSDAPNGDKPRVLTERGRREARAIGTKIPAIVPVLDMVVSSDAPRALETAKIAAASAGYTGQITIEPDIYNAELDTLLEIVQGLPDSASRAMLVGHNPGFEELARDLAPAGDDVHNLPTGGLLRFDFDLAGWRDVRSHTSTASQFHTPDEW